MNGTTKKWTDWKQQNKFKYNNYFKKKKKTIGSLCDQNKASNLDY